MDALKEVELPAGLGETRGSEHEVWLSADGMSVIKATHPGEFGRRFGPKPFATMSEYLERIQLSFSVFGLDWRVLGTHGSGRQLRVVTSQPAFAGRPATFHEIRAFLEERGFKFHRTRFGDAWFRACDSMIVSDAEPKNCVMTVEGLVPFDFLITQDALSEISAIAGFVRSRDE